MRGVAVTLACFAIISALLAWSRWLARRRLALAGHLALAALCATLALVLWAAGDGLRTFEPLRPGTSVAEIRFDDAGPGRYRATLVRLPGGRVQVFELLGERWRIGARTLHWHAPVSSLGLQPVYRLELLESGTSGGATAATGDGRSYALANGAGMDVWGLVHANPRWARYAEARVTEAPWEPMKGGAEYSVVATGRQLLVVPVGTEVPVLAPPHG